MDLVITLVTTKLAKRLRIGLLLLVALLLAASCAKRVTRTDADEQIDLSGRWNDTDSRLVAEEMIKDSMSSPWLKRFERENAGRVPVVIVYSVKNRSSEHINTQTFVKNLERAFVNSGVVDVVASQDQRAEIRGERANQQSGFVENPALIGKELGADFVLTGVLNTINDRLQGNEVVFYQVNLELISVQTNRKAWIGEKQIKKLVDRAKTTF